jgi:hypothetical protein
VPDESTLRYEKALRIIDDALKLIAERHQLNQELLADIEQIILALGEKVEL